MDAPDAPPKAKAPAKRSPYRSVLRLKNYRRLWLGMSVSSLGDWIGLFALLAITNKVARNNPLAIAGLMIARVVPAFVVGPLAGVALDRIDRRRAMIVCDICRACLIATVPFVRSLPVLYAVTFLLETISLVWMPAKDALVPQLVPNRWLVAANSLALFTTYGVFPVGALAFTGLVGLAGVLRSAFPGTPDALQLDALRLALWLDTATFLLSAVLVWRISYPGLPKSRRPLRARLVVDELLEGLRYLRRQGQVTRVVRGIGFALAGGAVVFSLGAPYVSDVLGGGEKGFGGILTASGIGVGAGVLVLGLIGDRIAKATVFAMAMLAVGCGLVVTAVLSSLGLAIVVAAVLGAFGGMAYATGFALVQEVVEPSLLGRTMAALQTVIRLSLLTSLVLFPALAGAFESWSGRPGTGEGIRMALAVGGLTTIVAGVLTARDVLTGRIGGPR